MKAACHLASQRNTLNRMFAAVVFAVAGYIIFRSVERT
jgi:hypothetical protein